jgi:hypothetical protein
MTMNLIARLDRVNWWLRVIDAYARRVSMAFFMPRTRDRVLFRLGKKFRHYNDERRRIEALINADPKLKAQLRAREIAAQPPPDLALPRDLREQATRLTTLMREERHWKSAYQEAVWYYKDGRWKHDGIAVERITALLDEYKLNKTYAQRARVDLQHAFEAAVAATMPNDPKHILTREQLMREAEKGATPPSTQSPFRQWIATNTPTKQPAELHAPGYDQIAALAKGR